MKKTITLLVLAAMLTGCTSKPTTDTPAASVPDDSAPAVTTTATTTTAQTTETTSSAPQTEVPAEDSAAQHDTRFEAGLWEAILNGIPYGFYIMYDDIAGGATLNFVNRTGTGFEYELGVNEVTFHYGDSENSTHYTIDTGDPAYVHMTANDRHELILIYFSEGDADDLEFFTNEELAGYASELYEQQYGKTPPCVETQTNVDGTVTIQLYENLSDHNSTWAWYTVDRRTGIGTDDISGEEICLIQ